MYSVKKQNTLFNKGHRWRRHETKNCNYCRRMAQTYYICLDPGMQELHQRTWAGYRNFGISQFRKFQQGWKIQCRRIQYHPSAGFVTVWWYYSGSYEYAESEKEAAVGTVFRSEAAGATGILMSGDCVDIYNPKVIRRPMGAILRLASREIVFQGKAVPRAQSRRAARVLCGTLWMIRIKWQNVHCNLPRILHQAETSKSAEGVPLIGGGWSSYCKYVAIRKLSKNLFRKHVRNAFDQVWGYWRSG